MSGVSAIIAVHLSATYSEAPPVGSAAQVVNENPLINLSPGTGVGNSDTMFTKAINIAASGSASIDLTGSATDAFGATVAFLDVQAILVEADTGNVNDIIVGGGVATAWIGPFGAVTDDTPGTYNNGTIAVRPGGAFVLADRKGWPVVATTGDLLKLANSGSGTAVTGKITLIGRSA